MSSSAFPKALFLLALSLSLPLRASAPYQVADLNTTTSGVPSSPLWRVRLNDIVFFETRETSTAPALWRTDGTAAGTFKLVSMRRTPVSLPPLLGMVAAGNVVYFDAYDADGWKVWKSDGSVAGTVPITAASSSTILAVMDVLGNHVLCRDLVTGALWSVSEGSAQSLGLIGADRELFSSWASFQGRLYVGTPTGIWKSDGTASGTTKVTSTPAWNVVATATRLFFIGSSDTAGVEPWVSDGTTSGTRMIADLKPGTASTFIMGESPIAPLDASRVLFLGTNGELGVSDGTSSGTRVIRTGTPSRLAANFCVLNGVSYFPFDDGEHGRELWRSDGTDAGTRMVSDLSTGANPYLYPIVAGATRVYYYSQGPKYRELFESDGTPAGTHIVNQPGTRWTGSSSATPTIITSGDVAFFGADDIDHGDEPWITDGTEGGRHMIANLEPDLAVSSSPSKFFAGADRLYLTAQSNDGPMIWRTDGTAEGTVPVLSTPDATLPVPFGIAGNTLYLDNDFFELWKTDGTPEGYKKLVTAQPGLDIHDATTVNGQFYFFDNNRQLWTTDGTPAGTTRLISLPMQSRRVIGLAGRAYFITTEGIVFATDGTLSGTRSIARGSGGSTPLFPFAGSLFTFSGASQGSQLWRVSGSAGDAAMIHHSEASSYGPPVAVIGTTMLFPGRQLSTRQEQLWKTDGTAAGTAVVKEFASTTFPRLDKIVSLGSRAVFTADDGVHGTEPWVSDGTPDGTKLLRDIGPGALQAGITEFAVADGIAYFNADDGLHGLELWQTDGTPEGTVMVADMEPGASGSSPDSLTRVGDLLYFAATTKAAGRELWAYPLPSAAVTIDDARANESDRKIVVPIRLTRAARQRVTVSYETSDDSAKAGIDYTPATGTVTFEIGETAKTITVAIADDSRPGLTRSFFVKIKDAAIPIERTAAAAIIEDDDVIVDLVLSLTGTLGSGPMISVRNDGPSNASNVTICAVSCSGPFELKVGESVSQFVVSRDPVLVARVTQYERDSNPANNAVTWLASYADAARMYVTPPSLRPGDSGTVTVVQSTKPGFPVAVTLTSSDPSVIRVPPSITITEDSASAAFQALKSGTATITATTFASINVATVRVVGAGEPLRTVATISLEYTSNPWTFGAPNALFAYVTGVTNEGIGPTGSVSFFDDGALIGTVPMVNQRASITVSDLKRLGTVHVLTATYSGDANFFETTTVGPPLVIFFQGGTPSFGAIRLPGTQNVLIVARGFTGYPPAGTLTVLESGTTARSTSGPLARTADLSSATTVFGVSAAARTLTLSYTGDPYYRPVTVTIPISIQRIHTAH